MMPLRMRVGDRVFAGAGFATIIACERGVKRVVGQAHMDGFLEFGDAMEKGDGLDLGDVLVECVVYHQAETYLRTFPVQVTWGEGPESMGAQHWILYFAGGNPFVGDEQVEIDRLAWLVAHWDDPLPTGAMPERLAIHAPPDTIGGLFMLAMNADCMGPMIAVIARLMELEMESQSGTGGGGEPTN